MSVKKAPRKHNHVESDYAERNAHAMALSEFLRNEQKEGRRVVEGGSTFSKLSLLETAKDYRRGVVDLWYEEHEMTVEDCITPVIDEDNFRKLPA